MDSNLIECRSVFSNGSEYEWFLEHWCDRCTRFRNERCRIYRLIEEARWDESVFPYKDLMDYKHYGGKACRQFTTEKKKIVRRRKQLAGQTMMEVLEGDTQD